MKTFVQKNVLVMPDPVYGAKSFEKFINKLMEHGKKSIARRIVYNAIELFAKK